ncbi:hypothetical protein V5O48_008273 [Marasmius crinis-equi]|uniref:F-box domain-containing protein n=1 Tax=Marasmius crinis-equi TaxID=585013 RepID=A0ABR3FES0_9AGAR
MANTEQASSSRTSFVLYSCTRCDPPIGEGTEAFAPSSILDSLSQSNLPPSPVDLGTLGTEYEKLSRTKLALDTEIGRLKARLAALEEQRIDVEQLLPTYKSALNPLRRFPNEILAQIFELCVEEDIDMDERMKNFNRDEDFPSTLDTEKCPWVLGQVCRRWRELVLSLPELWASIDMNWKEGLTNVTLDPFIERRLSLTLRRARDQPLSVSWYQDSCHERALSILCSRSFQWKEATIRTGVKGLKLLAPYHGMFPSLSTLHLHFEEDDGLEDGENDAIFSIFHVTPALRNLTLSGHLPNRRFIALVPWEQITSVKVKPAGGITPNLGPIIPLLRSAVQFDLESFNSIGQAPSAPTILPHLCTLVLTPGMNAMFESVTLPGLKTLRINVVPPPGALLRFLERSSCQLEELSLLILYPDVLVQVLQAPQVQSITTLRISGMLSANKLFSVENDVLNVLRLKPVGQDSSQNDNILCNLSVLSLWGDKKWSDSSLVEMLASRVNLDQSLAQNTSRLQAVEFNTMTEDGFSLEDEAASEQMRGLIEAGLEAKVGDEALVL